MKTNLHTQPIKGFTSVNAEERKALGIRSGDTVRVHQKIKEKGKKGERIRIQVFEGIVLATKHGAEPGATFTVRKVSSGVGMERIFPLYSPVIDKIEIVKRSKVRRSKLYHIREKVAREIKRQMRRTSLLGTATLSDAEYQDNLEQERAQAQEAAEQAEAEAQAAVTAQETEAQEKEQAVEEPAEETQEADETAQSEEVQSEETTETEEKEEETTEDTEEEKK